MTIPLEPDFTVVTGPNGSGKSNILDGILFCLGLATSRGMRAERLPDLVNSGVLRAGKSAETVVSVRFDLKDWVPDAAEEGLEPPEGGPWITSDQKEWTVTRRLRVMPGGSYSSSYSADGEPCNLQQLQTQLRRLRVDPEGSNVVMQGDVTRIVSMSNRDRRGLIDELAGIALFDNRIEQTRIKLDDVHERQERCRIVEQELINSKQRLQKDCQKASLYKDLKGKFQVAREQEKVLFFEEEKKQLNQLKKRQKDLELKESLDSESISEQEKKLSITASNLKTLQDHIKLLGEDKLLSIQAEIAGLDAENRDLERQANKHKEEGEKLQAQRQELLFRKEQINEETEKKNSAQKNNNELLLAEEKCKDAEAAVDSTRRRLSDVAGLSGAWIEENHVRAMKKQELNAKLNPLREKKNTLEENLLQANVLLGQLESDQERDINENKKVHMQLDTLDKQWNDLLSILSDKKDQFSEIDEKLGLQERTRLRLEQEQHKLEQNIARLESRKETLQESRGTSALRLLLESGLDGIHGLVAQLGEVKDTYRLALEVAAGSRMSQVVVENDRIAAKAIELLKKRRAGRLTFLPLNKFKNHTKFNDALKRFNSLPKNHEDAGLIGKAIDLIKFENIYENVFEYVFGDTLVFNDLTSARLKLGNQRSVTIDGELLERSGAMTGGSFSGRGMRITFGSTSEVDEVEPIRNRLLELGETLLKCRKEESSLKNALEKLRLEIRNLDQRQASLDAERSASKRSNSPLIERQKERDISLKNSIKKREQNQKDLDLIKLEIEPLIIELSKLDGRNQLTQNNGDIKNWKKLQLDLEQADLSLVNSRKERDHLLNVQSQMQLTLERLEDQRQSLLIEEDKLKDAVNLLTQSHTLWRQQNESLHSRQAELQKQQKDLETSFGEKRRERDSVEAEVAKIRQELQESQWKLDRLKEERESIAEEIRSRTERIQKLEIELPNPLPEISIALRESGLASLQAELQSLQTRMEDLEPVNMLALDELATLEKRLEELVQRLQVLTDERTELLLRIETVATLREEAFMEAFNAVDVHFREIFASLSEGDGHLQLDNIDEPLEGGLTLVAHPKGKAVRRLAAMSGGEKSLTALSFLFALQRFRPSPFYALDEVDSFLDGVNVERLAALISNQAECAQFLVVSHRRPMIGASNRTIGVTQARGSHTQVVGLPIAA